LLAGPAAQRRFRPSSWRSWHGGRDHEAAVDLALRLNGHEDAATAFLKWLGLCAGWAVYEWECCLQHPEAAAREGAKFIADHIIEVTDYAFDDFAAIGGVRGHLTNYRRLTSQRRQAVDRAPDDCPDED
jgi:hypothetical protein